MGTLLHAFDQCRQHLSGRGQREGIACVIGDQFEIAPLPESVDQGGLRRHGDGDERRRLDIGGHVDGRAAVEDELELQRLKAQAAKIPPKIRVYSFVMLVCFMLIYIVAILMQILTSMGGLFG